MYPVRIIQRFFDNYVGVSRGFPMLWWDCIPQHIYMKNIEKTATLTLCEIFSQTLFHQHRMTIYNKFMKQIEGDVIQKVEVYLPLHEVSFKVEDPPEIMEVKTPLNTSNVKIPVTSRVKLPYSKCIHMVLMYAYSIGVIHSSTNIANMVCLPLMLKVELGNLIRSYAYYFSL